MAIIKCRYTIPVCELDNKHQYHSEYWFCDSDFGCETGEYERPADAGNLVNPTCKHCKYVSGEFEKSVKRYEYYDGELKVGRNVYRDHDIEYLEIDGRVLKEEDT